MCVCVCVYVCVCEREQVGGCMCVCVLKSFLLLLHLFMYFRIYPRFLYFAFPVLMFSFFLCGPFVVDIVDALVVAMFGLCENHTLIVSIDSCTPLGFLKKIL